MWVIVDDIFFVVVVAFAAFISVGVINWVGRRIGRALLRAGAPTVEREQRIKTFVSVVKGALDVGVLFIAALFLLNWFDVDLAPVLASAGIVSVIAGFAAQSLIKDFLAGFFILIEDQFAVGDVVEINGFCGTVEEMNLRTTLLRDMDGAVYIVPNGQIGIVTNYTRGWSRLDFKIAVDYAEDADKVIAVLKDECARFAADGEWAPRLDGSPNVLGVDALDAAAFTIRLLIKTKPGEQWAVAREFRRRVKARFDAEGIKMPYPYRVAFATGGPAERVSGRTRGS